MAFTNKENEALQIAVIGSGTVGPGIAATLAARFSGKILMHDINPVILHSGAATARSSLREVLEKVEDLHPDDIQTKVEKIVAVSFEEACKHSAFIFEAVSENLELKQKVFEELGKLCPHSTIFCSNTSSLSITDIASSMAYPERAVAAHFVYPAHLMPLVEICGGKKTHPSTIEKVYKFLKEMGKQPIKISKEIPGFICARLQAALLRECLNIYNSGIASVEDVDLAVTQSFGRRLNTMGPFAVADTVGIDLLRYTHATLFASLDNSTMDPLCEKMAQEGKLGMKTNQGFYNWTELEKKKLLDKRDSALRHDLKTDLPNAIE
ncbi:putative Lambda-crystallin [Cardiosporidium cionae]|uniref:Lambda-crystallin n=1 Tax=Cardiosporidium cionae TaxID=476202 RepID=A0ABQ7J614_9APIC|nr:putative Lambda-crystallin [Cardiosporidium cionae]|eukprot:KAF8819446.1 putative Lambda-crystallin [Cardiosporidium cionae]